MEAAKPPILEPATEAARLPISSSSSSSSSLSAAAFAAFSAAAAASSASACLSCATVLLACSEARARDRWCDAFASCLAVFLLAPMPLPLAPSGGRLVRLPRLEGGISADDFRDFDK